MDKIETLKSHIFLFITTMCDLLKPIFKHTILPDDVVRLISEFASVKERFNIKSEMWRLFNNSCPCLNDDDIDNKMNRCKYAIYWDLIDLSPCNNYVTLSSIDDVWADEWEDTLNYNLNGLMDMNSNELSFEDNMLVKSFERALGLNYSCFTGCLISKSRYERIDWAKFVLNHEARVNYCIGEEEDDMQVLYPDSDEEFADINLIST